MNILTRFKKLMNGKAGPITMQVPPEELATYLPANPVVVEAGAHNGTDTLALADQWPNGIVHAFEPVPSLCVELRRTTASRPNVHCHELALAAITGVVDLHLSEGASDGSSSVLPPERHLEFHPQVRFERSIQVPSVTLDDWASKAGIIRVDLLWLDLQGLEPDVLRAAPRILSTVTAVHTEVSLVSTYSGCALYSELRPWMEKQGFAVVRELLPFPDMGNVLFVRAP